MFSSPQNRKSVLASKFSIILYYFGAS